MERYNLPSSGIEVIITHDHKISTRSSYPHDQPIYATSFGNNSSTANSPSPHPLRNLMTRSLLVLVTLAAVGNVPVYSRIQLSNQDDVSQHIASALETEYELAQIDEADRAVEDEAERLLEAELNQYQYNSTTDGDVVMPPPQDSPVTPPADTTNATSTTATTTATTSPEKPSQASASPKAAEYGRWSRIKLDENQTLVSFLKANNLSHIVPIIEKQPELTRDIKTLKEGRKVFIRTKDNELNQLIYAQDPQKAFVMTRFGNRYQGQWDTDQYNEQDTEIGFSIHGSFSKSAHEAGLPTMITKQLVHHFKNDINFQAFRTDDHVSLIYEDVRYKNKSIFTDQLIAAAFRHKGQTFQRVRFAFADGNVRYLNPDDVDSEEVQRVSFNRRPIQGGRMSSGFGLRTHPVLRTVRTHKGTDFAAPSGTPIYATGDGRVKFVGQQSGYGKVVELSHAGDITTLYGHMSAFKQGLAVGNSIQRGQVIGYVGSTGRSTGNHVHYEFRQHDELFNPMTVALPKIGLFTPEEKIAFTRQATRLMKRLSQLQATDNTANNNTKEQSIDG